jgi:PDZ domain
MRRMLTCLMTCTLLFIGLPTVHAQSLFERLEQALTPGSAPIAPVAPEPPPTNNAPEALPAPLPTPPQADNSPAINSRPTLGVTVDPVTAALVRQHRLPVRSGALITAIVQDSPADQAGLPVGAVIVALDGLRIDSPADLVAAVQTARIDRPVELSYYDGERLYRKRVHLLGAGAQPALPTPPIVERREPQPLGRGAALAEQLGGQGQRPVLGRFGKILDGLVAPAAGVAPFGRQADHAEETALLHEQVHSLQEEVKALHARLAAIEKKLDEKAAFPER